MNKHSITSQPITPVPSDNFKRNLKTANPNTDPSQPHPPGGGPPPHRHDFEESFTLLEGEIEATFRGAKSVVRAGETLSIPANALHSFTNASEQAARLLCICAPAGQEEFFAQVGVPVATRTTAPPQPDKASKAKFMKKAQELAPKYRTELLKP